AKYLGKVRRMQLLEEHPDFKLQEYLRITKHVYYRSLNAAYQFIDGYVESKNLELQLFSGKQASGG
ncbi:MAG: hypothetical protein MJA83_15800, partial [Gammaproteobacteria bacterium]|nr:hypothetical protein [Gammaproteobacteria bacterium]